MKKLLIAFCCFTSFVAGACEPNAQQIKASYQIQTIDNHSQKVLRQTRLTLWRDSNRVAHQYAATQITEGWELVSPSLIKATRYFDQHQRAIEYQPGEVVHGKKERDYSGRQQLISDVILASLELKSSKQQHCQSLQHLSGFNGEKQIELDWLKQNKLIQQLLIKGQNTSMRWQLQSISYDQTEIKAFFQQRDNYQSTDYADIGDDHTDPFLTQMVNLGFIEHSASGFYQAHSEHNTQHNHSH